jgi:hypothetical protein
MPQKTKISWADSVRSWASGYKDSVAVDYDMSQMRTIYVHKDHEDSWKGGVEDNSSSASAAWQYWMVPTFFSIMIVLIIFAFVLYRDNEVALRAKQGSLMSLMKKEKQ